MTLFGRAVLRVMVVVGGLVVVVAVVVVVMVEFPQPTMKRREAQLAKKNI